MRIFERRETVGGRVRSHTGRGFTFDRGFRVLFTAYPAARRELDFEALDLRDFAPGRRSPVPGAARRCRTDAADAALAERTREALASWYPEVAFGNLALRHTDRVALAQFEQPPGLHATLPGPDAPDGPVYLAGDYTGWSSIQAALRSGERAASAVLADRESGRG